MEEKTKTKAGRNKKPTEIKRLEYITIKLTTQEKNWLKEQAYKLGMDISEYVRLKLFDRLNL